MRLLPIARLLRLPNVFTSFADIALGVCVGVAAGGHVDWWRASLLFLASGAIYLGGMVWNDWFDLEEDRRERPYRPLPSGQVDVRVAFFLGAGLLVTGFLLASATGAEARWIAGALILAVLLYDGWLKRTPIGPVSMASCRFINVLLGLTLTTPENVPWLLRGHLALVIGVYIIGVTWFARTEATRSERPNLIAASIVILVALLIALAVPLHLPPGQSAVVFPFLLVGFGFLIGGPIVRAIREPVPSNVQQAVKRTILGLVFLDATLATVFVGVPGLMVLFLLPPAILLGKWVYST